MAETDADTDTRHDLVVGRVGQLWRFPVKSLQGESLDSAELTGAGLGGDRRYGLIDVAGGHLLSAKSVPALFDAMARTDGHTVIVTLPDGKEHSADDPGVSSVLSDWLDREVELTEVGPSSLSYEMTFDPPNDEAEKVSWPAMDDSFLDLAPIHALTASSLAAMAEAYTDGEWDIRRFRPNVFLDTPGTGFVEDGWVGGDLLLGDGGAALHVDMAAVRCAMPLRAQPSLGDRPALARDIELFRAMTAEHNNHLGIYCGVSAGGRVSVGAEVTLTRR